ncbi:MULTISPECIES: hypothetical protein [unclassified Streptomyces]|uniref:hypothetical protein n=1 Tax=unclassified Streptomyces TaxID=2593676 RepID=UPI002DDB6B7D|nr:MULTISPECIES: hypothetical protein [unclassified Streptomyces]WSA93312.1 hypothetical protein OIE63_18290 [Streptomyces sp. NBC_01795]WSB77700.1 hypothetical protein OHB04_19220 [Streptomyces sp. NBC_01775]WSS14051.1 hypothetical protein OG533_20825 [Streptomyces sp. NBC_01186]WSS42870.1 hypothetical protein OG220_21530 [Streptomyces sp. NBC_01187]
MRDEPRGGLSSTQHLANASAYAGAQGGNALAVLERIERDVPLHIVDRNRPSVL